MMKRERVISIILPPVVFALGYFFGARLHPMFASLRAHEEVPVVANLFGKNIVDLNRGTCFTMDTLAAHEKNLIVFWSPTCKYCKQFFQNRLNQELTGIYCFPLTDDFEYVDFYIEQQGIKYPQLVKQDTGRIQSVDAPFVESIPMFLVVDHNGKIIRKHIGIENIDKLISTLYPKTNY